MRFRVSILIYVLILIAISACATVNKINPEQKYLIAAKEFNILATEYIKIQDDFSPADRSKIKQAFILGDAALDRWEKAATDPSYDYLSDMQTWLNAKDLILKIISQYTTEVPK